MKSSSVLMSVYKNDNPEYLKAALESIYEKQTRKPDEIVIVFDGKLTDELYKVLDDFKVGKEDVVFFYPQEVNKGLGEALRIGATKCTCDYILRMDSDDICLPERFERQLGYMEEHPDIDVLGSTLAEFIDSTDEITSLRVCPETHEEIVKMAKRRCPVNHSAICMKREALEKCGGYETLLFVEDYYLWIRMICNGCKFANLQEYLVYFRISKDFCEKRGSKIRIKGWQLLQKYMLKHKMINFADAIINMICIIGFTYCPGWVRKFAYSTFLRKDKNKHKGVQTEKTVSA